MKNKLLLFFLFSIFIAVSCKKEKIPSIVGEWVSTAVYSDSSLGGDGWISIPEGAMVEIAVFRADGSFSFFTDVPGGGGLYEYNYSSHELNLHYRDRDGNPTGSILKSIEKITDSKLVISYISQLSGNRKMEYTRVD